MTNLFCGCMSDCDTCNDSTTCLTCIDKSLYINAGKCLSSCPVPKLIQNNICVTSCNPLYFLLQNTCYKTCPDNYYGDVSASPQVCKNCDPSCNTCMNGVTCLTCKSDTAKLGNNLCGCSNTDCLTCKPTSPSFCLSCSD